MAMLKQPDLITSYPCRDCGESCKDRYCTSCVDDFRNEMRDFFNEQKWVNLSGEER